MEEEGGGFASYGTGRGRGRGGRRGCKEGLLDAEAFCTAEACGGGRDEETGVYEGFYGFLLVLVLVLVLLGGERVMGRETEEQDVVSLGGEVDFVFQGRRGRRGGLVGVGDRGRGGTREAEGERVV